jgi:sterol desaturase/sphingolipid hydroxylase (fatty acid hydroxylase superfamily)
MVFFIFTVVGVTLCCVIGLGVESLAGAAKPKSARLNACCALCQIAFAQGSNAALAPGAVWLAGKIGRPPLHVAGAGWTYLPSVLGVLALVDVVDYSFHRLEHRIPLLWAMHSLHHSDTTMNATTAYRHHWLDRALQVIIFLPLGLLIKADFSVMLGVIAAGWVIAVFDHSSLRIGFEHAPWLIVTPQFHRLHHSSDPRHYDRNFATFLPLWDILFRTYTRPEGYPATGVSEGEPATLKESLLWGTRSNADARHSSPCSLAQDGQRRDELPTSLHSGQR